jgi:predicted nucleic acid-binding protein
LKETIVCNTGPLIALALIERLDLLPTLYNTVLVPEAVHREVLQGGSYHSGLEEYRKAKGLRVTPAPPEDKLLSALLDPGEAAVIQLALSQDVGMVLIDERKGRKIARSVYHLGVIGTAGILVKANKLGLIKSVQEALESTCARRATGFMKPFCGSL